MAINGDCANFSVLLNAGVKNADLLIATTGDDSSNILACQIAKHFNVKKQSVDCRQMTIFHKSIIILPHY